MMLLNDNRNFIVSSPTEALGPTIADDKTATRYAAEQPAPAMAPGLREAR